MTSQLQRSRSPSAGTAGRIKRSNSASPQAQLAPSSTAAEVDSSSSNPLIGLDVHVAAGPFGDDTSFAHRDSHQAEWAPLGPRYSAIDQKEQAQARPLAADITNHTFLQSADFSSQADFGPGAHGSKHLSANALSQGHSPSNTADSSAFPSFDFDQAGYGAGAPPDPSVLEHIDAGVFDLLSSQQGGAKAAGQLEPMAAMQSHSPTPPHLLPDMVHHQSGSPSPHASPGFQQAPFHGMNRPRNTSESLDPSSAMFPLGQGDWSAMGSYRGHRRTPSDNYSDISSHSNQNSPYMPNLDNFDDPSPMLNSNQDPTFGGNVDLQRFSLSEPQSVPPPQYISPAHSPHPSPQLVAQKALPPFTAENNYGLQVTVNGQFGQPQNGGLEMFPGVSQEPFPSLNHTSPGELGAADQMSPPEISIDFAPESKSPFGNQQSRDGDALSPPQSNQSRNRKRAKSESHAGSRSASPALPGRGRSPSLQPQGSFGSNTLSPFDNNPSSRSPSPGRGRNGSLGGHARSSSNASDQRDYILDLAIPERTPSNGADNRRMQKHPATFCCHLCSKRFTRAYNLRSHLRTHTDERPYVCTICGKAFARQHDRKRHEGLHSGEKKYVCLGSLQSQQRWGCGRRFARADALGRHFRSEAGRVCIKPLLEEEAAERQKAWMEKQQQQQQQSQIAAAGLVATQPMLNQSSMDTMGSFLPAALLQQYPALAGIDWNSLQQGPTPEEDYAGRSSFDASSGGEYYDEFSENEMGAYPDALMTDMGAMPGVDMNQPMTMDQAQTGAAQGYGVYCGGNQTGDYLSDFDGR